MEPSKNPLPDLQFVVTKAPEPGHAGGTVTIEMRNPSTGAYGHFQSGSLCGDGIKSAGLFQGQRFNLVRTSPLPAEAVAPGMPRAASAPVSDDPTGK